MATIKERADKLKQDQINFLHLRASGIAEDKAKSFKLEKEYLKARLELIDEVTNQTKEGVSKSFVSLQEEVANRPPIIKTETGIRSLDMELVEDHKMGRGLLGGFSLGNYIQFSGERGSGKSSILLKIMSNITARESFAWFNFEMSDTKAVNMMNGFSPDATKIRYYDGSREIDDIENEIKFLYASGVRHFLIDSMMKISSSEHKRGYESFSYISGKLAELCATLEINIYLINQMSADSQRTNTLMLKHGNDAEYDADYIFFVMKKRTEEVNDAGQNLIDESCRILVCNKNRVDHRLFAIEISKEEVFGIQPTTIDYVDDESYEMEII